MKRWKKICPPAEQGSFYKGSRGTECYIWIEGWSISSYWNQLLMAPERFSVRHWRGGMP